MEIEILSFRWIEPKAVSIEKHSFTEAGEGLWRLGGLA
jgi:hypothetical protein